MKPIEIVKNSRFGDHFEINKAIEEMIAPAMDTGLAPKRATMALAIGPGFLLFFCGEE